MRQASLGDPVGASANGMPSPLEQHSFVLSLDYRVDDVQRTWSLIKDSHSPLASLGAHHVVLYTSTREPDRVLVTVGIRHRASIEELLRSPAVFQWFDRSGVNDIPAIFAGQVLEKVSLAKSDPDPAGAGVIVGAVSTVGDVSNLMAKVHGDLDRFHDAGVRKVWLYRAVDDGQEVLTLLEIDSVANAQRWIDHPDAAAEWMSSAGMGGYPDLFVGKLAYVMDLNLETAG